MLVLIPILELGVNLLARQPLGSLVEGDDVWRYCLICPITYAPEQGDATSIHEATYCTGMTSPKMVFYNDNFVIFVDIASICPSYFAIVMSYAIFSKSEPIIRK